MSTPRTMFSFKEHSPAHGIKSVAFNSRACGAGGFSLKTECFATIWMAQPTEKVGADENSILHRLSFWVPI